MTNDITDPYPQTEPLKRTATRIANRCLEVEASVHDLDLLHHAHGRRTTLKKTITRLLYEFARTIEANGIDDPAHYSYAINHCRIVLDGFQRGAVEETPPEGAEGHDGRGTSELAREDKGHNDKPRDPEVRPTGQHSKEKGQGNKGRKVAKR